MEESMSIEPIFLGVIAGIVLLILGAGIAGFFILRKKKNRAAPPARSDGLPLSPAAFPQPGLALKCVGGVLNGSSYPIADTLCIGTNAAFCQVLYPEGEPGICGIHCKITAANGQAQLFDIDSAGTFINGIPILPNVPYTMPVGSSFCIGSPNNVFVIAEHTFPAEVAVPSVYTEAPPLPKKKKARWIAVVSAAAVIAAVILFLLFGRNRETYTGVTGKAFAIPVVGYANLVFDGKEQRAEAACITDNVVFDTTLRLDIGESAFLWFFDTSAVPWETGASFDLKDFRDDEKCFVGLFKIFAQSERLVSYWSSNWEGFEYFDEANLTVLSLDGDKVTFYFYLKLSYNGENHALEGVARARAGESLY